ncbi:Membrane alanyl aminopeptidase . Metallo peptidase. MEROPS family M01 [Micromonospora sediminicola]|uniref:Aminopeptidase N n=1 Tax=Micromonospora sediminicola TaxID=946078 RepID=A0A1A9B6X3_9ACTN|nr:aminopeptidase N [Micromonospora sp. WMMA1996]SBT64846.1 Membrane alanyl aminopeptidase . Metallo peptidase. MEROPS family M01 [Micromonospora sediminicola]
MPGVRNLTQVEATERARLLEVTGYDISLDLSTAVQPTGRTFRSVTEVRFRCTEPGATTFIETAAESVRSATLNGDPVDLSDWSAEKGLTLTGLAAENVLVVDADFGYSNSGQGLHRTVDPVDGETYLYSQFETADAQKVYACFDQPDLKSVYTWHATVPDHWRVVSNMPVEREEAAGEGLKTVHFTVSERMSTYITALCAGPYHEVRHTHDGIDMGYFCRASMAPHLDADDLHLITTQGFDFFQEKFGVRYPLPKYDQLWVPDFNAGAMENFGCVTHAESHYIFRSQVTDFEYEQRANTVLHELAHMWFGDLVTMRWWNDLWLNESFAEWASHWCNTHATRFTDAWTTFLSIRKNWGYRQDQLSSTHPVYCEMPDLEAVEVNFDGITYAKGASVLKQLVAYVGEEPFLAGLRAYFGKHAWGNATFDDLLSELEAASGRELRKFAAQWLETAQVNTLRPEVTIGADGAYERVLVRQEAPAGYPTLRTHRIGVGLYDLTDGRLVRRELVETDVTGEVTELSALHGKPAADVLLLNDEDLTYTKLRLDERSMSTVVQHISGFDSSLARALCWTAAWDMTRDAELSARDYVALVLAGLTAETDINLVTATLRQATTALTFYADPAWAPTGWADLARTARTALAAAEPGSGFQLAWARAYASAARSSEDLATLRGWLDGNGVPDGLTVDTELRWAVLQALVANGAAGTAEVDAELAGDRTASGEREAAYAYALVPTEANKAAVWAQLTGPDALPNWRNRALLQGLTHPAQVELTAPYRERYFATVDQVWAQRDSEPAQEFVQLAYPAYLVDEDTVAATDAWLARDGQPASLRRLVAEGRDGVVRALKARERDARSA